MDDIIETVNHFAAVRYVIDHIAAPLSQTFIKKLHHILTYGTYANRKEKLCSGEYRTTPHKLGICAKDISAPLAALLKDYEKNPANMEHILDFHVRFEQIHPFVDYNGRVGRLIMLKECLRHGVDPFIIDDKRRTGYLDGIRQRDEDRSIVMDVCMEAQMRFEAQIDLQGLLECHAQYKRMAKHNIE